MRDQLIQFGFTETVYSKGFSGNWVQYEKNGWRFEYCPDENYMWVFGPGSGDREGVAVSNLTYEKIIKLIDFISEYE